MHNTAAQTIDWQQTGQDGQEGQQTTLAWHSLTYGKAPGRVQVIDDTTSADTAYRLACEGTGLLWRGDFQNGRQLLQALTRRADPERSGKRNERRNAKKAEPTMQERFHQYRMAQAQRARILGMVLLQFEADFTLDLRRAPDVKQACLEVYGPQQQPFVMPLRELLGVIGAHEWRKNGVPVAALHEKIHPHYGVFSPVRGEYIDLIAQAALPKQCKIAFDIGTGSGVLAAVLAQRGVPHIIATDKAPRALACAQDNVSRLQLDKQISMQEADLFPVAPAHADLIVCNPPWLPGKASSLLEQAVYDQDSRMLRGFLQGAAAHLHTAGQAWLVLSDLAELLGLRSRAELLEWIASAGLQVLGRDDTKPVHGRSKDENDPLHQARSKETTSLWRLGRAS